MALVMMHAADPAVVIKEKLGDLTGFHVQFSQVLVATYVRPNVTKGGIHLADQTRDEDLWQGKAGLIVSMGPRAFQDDPENGVVFNDADRRKIGDWVSIRPSDGVEIKINNVPCRLLQDVHVKMRIPHPDAVW